MSETGGRPVFLVGFMGSGKTAVGRALAVRLGRSFVDSDLLVEERQGMPIADIFRDFGEAHFRDLEATAVTEATGPGTIVAVGGGAFLRYSTRRFMRQKGCTVWLDTPLDVLRGRLRAGGGRPLWDAADPLGQRVLHERRRAVYALADLRLEAGERPVDDLVGAIARKIQRFFV